MANELEKRDDVAINSVTKRDPKTRKVIKGGKKLILSKTLKLGKRLIDALRRMKNMLEQHKGYAQRTKMQDKRLILLLSFVLMMKNVLITLTTNESGNVSFYQLLSVH